MLTNYTDIKAVIKTKLEALDIFVAVYNVNETKPSGYPCAMILETAGEGEIIDTLRNDRIFEFRIIIIQQMGTSKTPEQASTERLTLTDTVFKMFDEDPQLTVSDEDSVVRVKVTPISFDEITKDRPIFQSEIIVACSSLVNNR